MTLEQETITLIIDGQVHQGRRAHRGRDGRRDGRQAHGRADPAVPPDSADRPGRRDHARPIGRRPAHQGDGRHGGADRRRDGGADRGGGRRADGLRHGQERRPQRGRSATSGCSRSRAASPASGGGRGEATAGAATQATSTKSQSWRRRRAGMSAAALVLTVSDGVAAGTRDDESGRVACRAADGARLRRPAARRGRRHGSHRAGITDASDVGVRLAVTTGGTGLGPRDGRRRHFTRCSTTRSPASAS